MPLFLRRAFPMVGSGILGSGLGCKKAKVKTVKLRYFKGAKWLFASLLEDLTALHLFVKKKYIPICKTNRSNISTMMLRWQKFFTFSVMHWQLDWIYISVSDYHCQYVHKKSKIKIYLEFSFWYTWKKKKEKSRIIFCHFANQAMKSVLETN